MKSLIGFFEYKGQKGCPVYRVETPDGLTRIIVEYRGFEEYVISF